MFGGRIAFVEDYDLHVAHFLVQGCDLWLNNPRKPLEASGTSGMKACMNGVPQLSIGDGWWAEGYNGKNGWAIGEGQEYANQDEQDWHDVESLYSILEDKIVPLYYDRGAENIPAGWVSVMKEAIASVAPEFSAHRQVKEYTERFYIPAIRSSQKEQGSRSRGR